MTSARGGGGGNISGLRNQKPSDNPSAPQPSTSNEKHASGSSQINVLFDSNTRINWAAEDTIDSENESDIDEEAELDDLNNKILQKQLVWIAVK
ncbi:hypothetical protein D9758_018994 [Tetrapyrgos nigripes]|uniref:Uncharacterized protein n=1 Tax=Tetrapyrgos nigripes TaxID=182062 RepID=A0A8H5ESG7_9AGAR|nr:hypothetical protein D9758_018994 [Tetrapyrgos nigripes]